MIRKTISMPEKLGKYIDQRVKAGGYGNDSEFIRDLLRRDKEEREGIAAIQAAIDEGMEGPDVRKTVREIYDEALKLETKSLPAKRRRA